MANATPIVLGVIAALSWVAGLLFWRLWRLTRDRFFVFFALSFWIEAANRLHLAAALPAQEDSPAHYLVRLLAFVLILVAIWDKNRGTRR
jgi:hypothetical protein